ncbi:MAG: glycosyltransferase family 4 protein [Desulfobacterales bacterium]|nr:glycosyltransferase family 4 protein [Desulfobacterales bacterium]
MKRGDTVDVIALRRNGQQYYEKINNVNVFRIQKRALNERGKLSYLYRLLKFFIISFGYLSYKHIQNNYKILHIHSVPDFEVFAAIIPKLFGAKVILDIHDIVPEFYASKFGTNNRSIIYKCLLIIEKISVAFSDHVIISNDIWYQKLISRSSPTNKCTTVLNYPDEAVFYQREKEKNKDKFIMIYPGTINTHQGLDIAIKAVSIIKDEIRNFEFHIYGRGPQKDFLASLIEEYGLTDKVFFKTPVSINAIAETMSKADLGVIPKRNDPFGGEAFSTKSLEFMSLGVPVIVSKTKIDQYYFNESVVKFFEPDNEKDLADAILLLMRDKDLRDELAGNAQEFVKDYSWEHKKKIYFDIVDSLSIS